MGEITGSRCQGRHDEPVIYILAEHTVEATAYAAQVLGLPVRSQVSEATCIVHPSQLPSRIKPEDEVRATPMFWAWMDAKDAQRRIELQWTAKARDLLIEQRRVVSMIVAAVRSRGGVILPPYDTPQSMDRESVERWLAEG